MDEENEIIEENQPQTILESKGLIPIVFDQFDLAASEGFNTVTIRIDGRINSELDWKKASDQAIEAIEKGFALFWDIDLGLFEQLKLPLESQTQFLSLALSLEHFRDTLWKDFGSHSIGLNLYRGSADFSHFFKDDSDQLGHYEEWLTERIPYDADLRKELASLYFRDVAVEYLSLLASRLPDTIPAYLMLDATHLTIEKQLQLLNPDRFDHLNLAVKGSSLPFKAWGWDRLNGDLGYIGTRKPEMLHSGEVKIGVCLPLMDCFESAQWAGLSDAVQKLEERKMPFKLISESHLISCWEGLDYIIYTPEGVSAQGKRKLQGFCAAGGTAVSVGLPIGLAHDISISELMVILEK